MTNTADIFAQAMQAFAPFETAPHIAVAISGGGDSLALTLLLHDWVSARQGKLLALTVDHGLRPEAAQEAQAVHALLTARGIAHETLCWQGDKPKSCIQAAARQARYDLLSARCRQEGILHLALGHTRDDQAETVAMRQIRGNGGLAGMAAVRELRDLRLLRPVLSFSRHDLREVCRGYGVDWIEDPSNRDDHYERVRIRQNLTKTQIQQAVETAAQENRQSVKSDQQLALDLLHGVDLYAAGYAVLHVQYWRSLPQTRRHGVLKRLLATIAGAAYAPAGEAISGLDLSLGRQGFAGATLHGCKLSAENRRGVLITREAALTQQAMTLPAGQSRLWDHRFRMAAGESCQVRALGEDGVACLRRVENRKILREKGLAFSAAVVLPSFWRDEKLLYVPYLSKEKPLFSAAAVFEPPEPLCRRRPEIIVSPKTGPI